MQLRYRETYQTRPEVVRRWKHKTFPVECRGCGKKYEKIGTLAGWSGLCQSCGRSKKFNKLLAAEIQATSERTA